VRLRLDHITGKTLLLRPEQGFELQGSAIEILKLCTAEWTVDEIVGRLAAAHARTPRAEIADDIVRVLTDLVHRNLIQTDSP
jgi:coenzyme PQQ biosynthesis protein PqqD